MHSNLGQVYQARAQFRRAREQQRLCRADHTKVALLHNRFAALLRQEGYSVEARDLGIKALALQIKALDMPYPDIGHFLNNLGLIYLDLRAFALARSAIDGAAAVWEKCLGARHFLVAVARQNLETVWLQQGESEEAVRQYEQALAILRIQFQRSMCECQWCSQTWRL